MRKSCRVRFFDGPLDGVLSFAVVLAAVQEAAPTRRWASGHSSCAVPVSVLAMSDASDHLFACRSAKKASGSPRGPGCRASTLSGMAWQPGSLAAWQPGNRSAHVFGTHDRADCLRTRRRG
jgi:hypothetical protein